METTIMKPETYAAVEVAKRALATAKALMEAEAAEAIASNDPPQLVRVYADLGEEAALLREPLTELAKLEQNLSYNKIPECFDAAGIQNVRVTGYGLVSLNRKWACSMLNKTAGLAYLRETGQAGMIQDYVAPMTLAGWAKEVTEESGAEPPDSIFKTSINRYCSLRRSK